ncbi:hypothetical protein [Actinoplanes sp. NPDC051859]
MATLLGSDGSVVWLVTVLMILATGLCGAVLAATRPQPAPIRAQRRNHER